MTPRSDAPPPVWLSGQPGQWQIAVHAQPGARHAEVVGTHGDALKIRIAAPPVDGKANEALRRWFALRLSIGVADVELIAGASSRSKRLRVRSPLSASQLVACLMSA